MTARSFALIFGIFYVGFALLGMMPGFVTPMPPSAPPTRFDVMHGELFGLFPVNMLLTLVHLSMGAWGLAAFMGWSGTRFYARSAALIFALLGVMGLTRGLDTLLGAMPLHGHDVWLHLASAGFAAFVGWTQRSGERRSFGAERRRAIRSPIGNERRQGKYERRQSDHIPTA